MKNLKLRKMKKLAIFIACTAFSLSFYGQQDLLVSQYMFNHTFINPAATGINGYYNASLMHRNQWVKFEGAPKSQFLSVDGPVISDKMGLGILIQNEKIGVNRQTDMFASYSYIMDMDKIKLSMGLRAGATVFESNNTEHTAWDEEDVLLQANTKSYQPNFGYGIYLKHEKYYASISMPHLLNYDTNTDFNVDYENSNEAVRHYYLMGGYRFQVVEDFVIEPSILAKYVANSPSQLDANIVFEYKRMVSLGMGYRTDESFIVLTKFQISNKFQFGYSFDITMTDIKEYSKGSHEIMLNYSFGNKEKIDAPSFF